MSPEEFQQEVVRLRPRMLRQAERFVRSSDMAEDIVQDALLRLWTLHDELHLPLAPLALVLTRNLALNALRSKAMRSLDEAIDSPDEQDAEQPYARMMQVLETLPPQPQLILRLRHIEGLEYKAIARLLGSNEVAVRKAVSRARILLRDHYLQFSD
ncbi:MAG: sigma-70 family RNA polymerase sigma factor [Alloprevotella sp.]|nr:sigma-70 family RNA polymerase sigma factor [Alloprevotella sp.]